MKQGTENMIDKYKAGSSREKKLHQEALSMLEDAKRKISFIRMQLLKARNQKSGAGQDDGDGTSNYYLYWYYGLKCSKTTGIYL